MTIENNTAEGQDGRLSAMTKIRKLLALAGNEAANEQEAATAARQAESLMRKHQIDSVEITLKEIEQDVSFEQGTVDVSFEGRENYVSKAMPSWVGVIAVGVGRLHTCKVDTTWLAGKGLKIRFSGYAPDVLVATWTYTMLCQTVYRLSKKHGQGQGMAFCKSFRVGAASTLQRMLFELAHAKLAESQVPGTQALAIYDNKKARVEEMYGAQKTTKSNSGASSRAGYLAGKDAAAKINLSTAINSSINAKRIS